MSKVRASADKFHNETDIDSYVDHLQKKYLKHKEDSTICDNTDFSPSEIVTCSPSSTLTASEKLHYQRAMQELKTLLKIGENKLEKSVSDYENARKKSTTAIEIPSLSLDHLDFNEDSRDVETTLTQSVTLPTFTTDFSSSTSDKPRKSVRISLEPTTFLESEYFTELDEPLQGPGILRMPSSSKKMKSTDVQIIYSELMNIHMKINQKSQELAIFQTELDEKENILEEKERELMQREESVFEQEQRLFLNKTSYQKAKDVMARLQGMEVEVEEKFVILRKCHSVEIDKLNALIAEKVKEYKRMKNSFDVLKNLNDDLKAQESDYRNLNEKLQTQNQKLKKRLENLQRKRDFESCRSVPRHQVLSDQTNKSMISEKPSNADKTMEKSSKVLSNSLEALSQSLDWVSEVHLKSTSENMGNYKFCREITVDKCLKILPLLVEVIRSLSLGLSQSKHHLPFLRFIYWSLHNLEDSHHGLLSTTARRIGEELIKPASGHFVSESKTLPLSLTNSSQLESSSAAEGKAKIFFYSSNPEIRMLSSLIVIKTLHQVDILAQVFQQMKKELKAETNRLYFLEYAATRSLLPYLTYKTNKSLLGNAVDVMLQMSMETTFLEQCSCESWFRAISSAVRAISESRDDGTLEKLSVILQKLSKTKKNKKFFETFSLGKLLHDYYRDCDQSSTFLSLNLRSVLFNLNMIKTS